MKRWSHGAWRKLSNLPKAEGKARLPESVFTSCDTLYEWMSSKLRGRLNQVLQKQRQLWVSKYGRGDGAKFSIKIRGWRSQGDTRKMTGGWAWENRGKLDMRKKGQLSSTQGLISSCFCFGNLALGSTGLQICRGLKDTLPSFLFHRTPLPRVDPCLPFQEAQVARLQV